MRLFTAIELPPPVRRHVGSLRRPLAGCRWTAEAQLHVTLRFLGEIERARLPRVRDALGSVRMRGSLLRIWRTGRFPPGGPARILWAGVAPAEPLACLYDAIETALRAAGFEPETRPYAPHVTLARLSRPPRREVQIWLDQTSGFSSEEFRAGGFTLFSSELDPAGATHRAVETFPRPDAGS